MEFGPDSVGWKEKSSCYGSRSYADAERRHCVTWYELLAFIAFSRQLRVKHDVCKLEKVQAAAMRTTSVINNYHIKVI